MSIRHWPGRVTSVLRSIVQEYREANVTFMAGSIAYSAFLSLLPLLLLTLLVTSTLGGERFADFVIGLTEQYLTPDAQGLLVDALTRATGRAGFSLFGFVFLLWAILKVFRFVDVAFSTLYHTPRKNGIVDQVRDGTIVLLAVGVAVVAMFVATLAAAVLPAIPYIETLSVLFLVVALTIAFVPVYYVFPDVDLSLGDVLPGALVAAIGWTILQALFQVYVQFSSTSDLYGVIGGVVLLVTYLYFASLIVLVGATTNVVLSNRIEQTSQPTGSAKRQRAE